MLEASG
jgi:hypothetical protein